MVEEFPRSFDKYILLDRIASGGMGDVFRAKLVGAKRFQRLLAIKCIRKELAANTELAAMFEDEAKLAAQLNHSSIAQIFELGHFDGQLFIAMELIEGRDARHILRTAGADSLRLPRPFVAYVIARAAEGLDYAHRRLGVDGNPLNLVHRDISPQNILVGYDGQVKIIDFGIAKAAARSSETRGGLFKGNVSHMAPEQALGKGIDHRADIFGLGTVLFELLSGVKLFDADTDLEVLELVRQVDLSMLDANRAKVGADFEPILRRCLAKEPADRYGHASELVEALTPMLFDDKSLFSSMQAAEVMQTLFGAEIIAMQEQLRKDVDAGVWWEEKTQPLLSLKAQGRAIEVERADEALAKKALEAAVADDDDFKAKTVKVSADVLQERLRAMRARMAAPDGSVTSPLHEFAPTDGPAATPTGGHRKRMLMAGGLGLGVLALALGAWALFGADDGRERHHPSDDVQDAEVIPEAPRKNPKLEEPGDAPAPAPQKPSEPPVMGYLSIKVRGAKTGRVFIDGQEVGKLPLAVQRVAVGKHEVTVVELKRGKESRAKSVDIVVGTKTSKRSPQKAVVDF